MPRTNKMKVGIFKQAVMNDQEEDILPEEN